MDAAETVSDTEARSRPVSVQTVPNRWFPPVHILPHLVHSTHYTRPTQVQIRAWHMAQR